MTIIVRSVVLHHLAKQIVLNTVRDSSGTPQHFIYEGQYTLQNDDSWERFALRLEWFSRFP